MKKLFAIFVALVMIVALAVPISADDVNLIVNGDFEAGNTGFTSDYNYKVDSENISVQNELWDPDTYAIGIDPNDYHYLWTSYADHTDPGVNMMIVNAQDSSPSGDVWAQTVVLPDYNPIITYRLMAGQTWEAGEVQVKFENGKIYVRMILTDQRGDLDEGWRIYGMKVDIKSDCTLIPQKNGNPIPGQFANKLLFIDGTLDTGWKEMLGNWSVGSPLCIAAHADIKHLEVGHWEDEEHDFCVVSGTGTGIVGGGNAVVTAANTWANLQATINSIPDCLDIANYIWDAAFVTNDCANFGGMVDFVQEFNIIGTPKSATLKIAADNAYAWTLNGGTETAVNLAPDWRTQVALGNFDPPDYQGDIGSQAPVVILDGNQTAWGIVKTYDVLSDLKTGSNTLNVTALNADWNTTDPLVNPAMVIYKICGTSVTKKWVVDQPYGSETGWGEGDNFPGANWAMCMDFTPSVPPTYKFSFWAANSYPGNQADLDVFVNGEKIGNADLEKIASTGVWTQFTFPVSGVSGSTEFSIQNKYNVYSGDDFALDDISLVQD